MVTHQERPFQAGRASAMCRQFRDSALHDGQQYPRPIAFDTRPVGKERHSLGNTRSVDPLAGDITSMARIAFEIDHQIRRLGLVGQKALRFLVDPTGEIHHHAAQPVGLLLLDGFHNIEAVAVEKVSVIAEQPFEFRHHRMLRWDGLGLVLMQSLSNLCGVHLHRTTLSIGFSFAVARPARPPTREWSRTNVSSAGSATVYLGWLLTRSTRVCGIWVTSSLATHWQRPADGRTLARKRATIGRARRNHLHTYA